MVTFAPAGAQDGVVAEALEVLRIDDVRTEDRGVFSRAETAYAHSKSDPERRLAARLAAKRAAARLLGVALSEVEVTRGPGGPPRLVLHGLGAERLKALGATRILVSLTHGETHAAASVLLLRDGS